MIILDSMSLAAVIRQRIHGLFFSGLTVKAYNNSIFYSTTTKNIWMAFWWLKRTVKKVFELLVPHSENNFSFCKPFTLLYSVSSYANFYALSFVSLAYPFFLCSLPLLPSRIRTLSRLRPADAWRGFMLCYAFKWVFALIYSSFF